MRKPAAIGFASLLAATPVLIPVAQAQTVTTTTETEHREFAFYYSPGFYIVGGIALIGVTLGVLALTEEHHHHHHQAPVSP